MIKSSPLLNIIAKICFPLCILAILMGAHLSPLIHKMSAGLAVLAGITLSMLLSNPYEQLNKKIISITLPWSIVGLGCGMNLITVARVGMHGIHYTIFSILICVILGITLGKLLRNKRDTSVLITFGTAICGGSAIAAIASTIKAKHHEISVSLAIVFILNAISLFIFPAIGHYFHLSETQFGLWSALAIQDTSSVVGATLQYGAKALEVGTTVKLVRALWIVPVTLMIGIIYACYIPKHARDKNYKYKKPWFILGFLTTAALVTWIPALKFPGLYLRNLAEQGLIIALFCIGASVSRQMIKEVGKAPFIQGILLWLIMAVLTLIAIKYNYIAL